MGVCDVLFCPVLSGGVSLCYSCSMPFVYSHGFNYPSDMEHGFFFFFLLLLLFTPLGTIYTCGLMYTIISPCLIMRYIQMWSKNAILHSMLYPYHHTLVWYNHFYSSHSHINVFLFPYIAIPVCMSLTHLSYDVLYCSRLTRLPSFIVLKWGQPVCATCEKEVPTSGLLKWCTACLVVLLPWVADLNAGAGCLVAGVPGDLVPRIHTLGILRRLRCSCGFWQEGWIVGPDTILYNGLVIKVNQTVATRVKPGGQS